MARLIKRYGSRKLYDTQESRYVSLEEIAGWIREGEEIQVMDNASSDDVTAQTLTQIISEEGRKRSDFLSNELLHDLIRAGGTAVSSKVKQIQMGVEGFVKKSLDRIVPISHMRDEMGHLRSRLEELEAALAAAEERETETATPEKKTKAAARTPRKVVRKSTTGATKRKVTRKPAAKKAGAAENKSAQNTDQNSEA